MGKGSRIRRGRKGHGESLRDVPADMSPEACLIAISEMTDIPAEKFCNWVVIGWSHNDRGGHYLSLISPCMMVGEPSEFGKLELLLEKALADARHLAREETRR